jgi:hypothetical protein
LESTDENVHVKKTEVHLRLQFIHKPVHKKWFRNKYPFLIQNEPFKYGLSIKNIGSSAFSGAAISEFIILHRSSGVGQEALNHPKIKPLNPDEEYEFYFDRYTLWHEGSIDTKCKLLPDSEKETIITYQHHRDHDFDEKFRENEWWHDYYCQSQQQLLQTRTNNLILGLTVITVVEAIVGLSTVLRGVATSLAWTFNKMHQLFAWLAS